MRPGGSGRASSARSCISRARSACRYTSSKSSTRCCVRCATWRRTRIAEPTAEDVAHLVDRHAQDVRRLLALNERMGFARRAARFDPMLSVGEALADENCVMPDARPEASQIEAQVQRVAGALSERQRNVIERRYGLNGARSCDSRAARCRISSSRASAYGRFSSRRSPACVASCAETASTATCLF